VIGIHADIAGPAGSATDAAGDPRVDAMYRRDVLYTYAFVVLVWLVVGSIFAVAAAFAHSGLLIAVLGALGCLACLLNTLGMVQNARRLGHERSRFYPQDLYWQDQQKARRQSEKAR
jgi:hypothetical protein